MAKMIQMRAAKRWPVFAGLLPIAAAAVIGFGAVALYQTGALQWLGAETSSPAAFASRPVAGGVSFSICHGNSAANCIVDGDTLRVGGVKIRIADIDTPEVFSPQCAEELALGNRATQRLQVLMNAGAFELHRVERDEDRYGRKLRVVVRDGHSLGDVLVAEGLARTWDGARHPWCG